MILTQMQFPKSFYWGVSTSAYQIEGASEEDGRGASIWDVFSHQPGKVVGGDTGDIACDSYHRVEEDLDLLDTLGVGMYRFSIAWPRIIPDGSGEINRLGLAYYDQLVDGLLAKGILPLCTLYHWDLPQSLQEKGGWANRQTAFAFEHYAGIVFEHFRGRIMHWITINEPWCVSFLSYALGQHAPGLTDLQAALEAAHHTLLAHGLGVKLFRAMNMPGQIGIAPNTEWFEPETDSIDDREAALRRNEFITDWFIAPVLKGIYPARVIEKYNQGGYTVPIKDGDFELISLPIDFLGINYYTGGRVRSTPGEGILELQETFTPMDKTDFHWNIYPDGFYHVLTDLKEKFGNIPIYITENGACFIDPIVDGQVQDKRRIAYLESHLDALHRSVQAGVNVQGYMCWSLMDNFEWSFGYCKPFGLVHVDFQTLIRTPKASFSWYQRVIRHHGLE